MTRGVRWGPSKKKFYSKPPLWSQNVTFLNGKSVSRMKSFFRAVKCFFWVSHLHLKWTFVARACEGLQGSTRGANGSRIKNILGKEKWFHEDTFYKLRMGLCSMITGMSVFSEENSEENHYFTVFFTSGENSEENHYFIVFFTSEENSEEKS